MSSNNAIGVIFKLFVIGTVFNALCEGQLGMHKRMPNVLHHLALRRLPGEYFNKILQRSLARARERRGHLTDAGYGSRVSAGSNIASAVMARQGLFGITGPGRRKRLDSTDSSSRINSNTLQQYLYSK